MNKPLRSSLALAVSLALTVLSPGGTAWAQFARTAAPSVAPVGIGSVGAAGAAPVKVAVPALSNSAPPVLPTLSLPSAVAPRASAAAPAAAAARDITVSAVLTLPAPFASAASFKKDKAMPDETGPRRDGGPDGTDGLDGNGNPTRRGGEGGPDDTTDPDQGGERGGNDGLFSGLKGVAAAPNSASLSRFFDGFRTRPGAAPALPNGVSAPSARPGLTQAAPPAEAAAKAETPAPAHMFSMMSPAWTAKLGAVGRFLNSWVGAGTVTAAGLGLGTLTGAITPAFFAVAPLYALFIVPSLILHEMGHAKAAEKLGDPTARLQGRLDFSPKGLLTHISPLMTIAVPLLTLAFTGLLFGGAVPVNVNERNLARPTKDMAKIALAGPGVNLGLAAVGGLAVAGLVAAGASAAVVTLASTFVFFNVMLAVFNLLPFFPLDGHHVVRHVLTNVFKAPGAAAWLDKHAGIQLYGLVMLMVYGGAYVGAMISGLASVFMLPAALLSGLLAAMPLAAPSGPANAAAPAAMPESTVLLVQLSGAQRPLGSDIHLGAIDVRRPGGMGFFRTQQDALGAELEAAGLSMESLSAFNASPIASYRRINTATVRVPVSRADAFRAEMLARGHKVYENAAKSIVTPIEDRPDYVRPEGFWGGISMKDTLKLSTADKVHDIARGRWGAPGSGFRNFLARTLLRLSGDAPAQPKVAVIDTGVDIDHPLVKPGLAGHKDVQPGGDGIDDNGHGTWVTSMVLNFAPWLKSITHYKAFKNGGATTDDVLKGLTMAANDGNIIMSNSWGDDGGDPDGPDSQLVAKLAAEGRIMVFAAGNNGYSGANTVGSPAIASYKDARTGAIRVIAVAATDANKKVTSFSSKGLGSAVTSKGGKWENYPHKPDLAEQGDNTEGAWPGGRTRSISGTSMSTPKMAGTIALLAQMFGVTEVGEKLDKIVLAVFATLSNERNQTEAAIGQGFSVVKAAYDALVAQGLSPAAPGWVARLALRVAGGAR
ncbi:hypothetical protein EPO15_16660 [bacterium]|nr:MAG: hypothetical protein EPO15_16660 [bacterium]